MRFLTKYKIPVKAVIVRTIVLSIVMSFLSWYVNLQLKDSEAALLKQHKEMQASFKEQKKDLQSYVDEKDSAINSSFTDRIDHLNTVGDVYTKTIINEVDKDPSQSDEDTGISDEMFKTINAARAESQL